MVRLYGYGFMAFLLGFECLFKCLLSWPVFKGFNCGFNGVLLGIALCVLLFLGIFGLAHCLLCIVLC